MKNTPPDWSAIFANRPDLESPGYQEALRDCREKTAKEDPMKRVMERIHKERQSDRNKSKRKSAKK